MRTQNRRVKGPLGLASTPKHSLRYPNTTPANVHGLMQVLVVAFCSLLQLLGKCTIEALVDIIVCAVLAVP